MIDELKPIAQKYATDKTGHHDYTPIYHSYFKELRGKEITLLEGGIGGYSFPDRGGGSLKMWAEYFPKGKIHGFDIYDKSALKGRFTIHNGSQDDKVFLNSLINHIGAPDIIIDDASHISPLTIETFQILFPRLKSGGIYVVEDCHTSYWEEKGGDGTDFKGCRDFYADRTSSVMNYFKRSADDLNLDTNPYLIKSIHFYKEMIICLKQ